MYYEGKIGAKDVIRRQGSAGRCLVAACFSSSHFLFGAALGNMPAFVPRIAPLAAKVHVPRCCVLVSSLRSLLFTLFHILGFATFSAVKDGPVFETVAAGILFVLRVPLAAFGIVERLRVVVVVGILLLVHRFLVQ